MHLRSPVWLRQRWGVRAAAALSAATLVAVALAAAGVALVLLQERAARSAVEGEVRAYASAVAARLTAGQGPEQALIEGTTGFTVAQVLDTSGTVIAASPQLRGQPPLRPKRPAAAGTASEVPSVVERSPLLVVQAQAPTPGGPRLVLAGASLAATERGTATITRLALIGVPLLALVAGVVTYGFTARALRPVEAIRARVATLSDRDVGLRVPEPFARDEVGRLARTMNDMLARLEAGSTARRRFVADASHELRSPLATLAARLELVARRGCAAADIAVMDGEVERMARLVEGLLVLARADERALGPRLEEVDLDELVEGEAARLTGREPRLQVRARTVPVRIWGDRGQWVRVLSNLGDNAARHARSHVTLEVCSEDTDAVLRVGDDGPGIPVGERRRVLERFVRLDDARGRESGGAGLGLAIVDGIVTAHRGRIEVGESDDGGALVTVRLPVQPPEDGFDSPSSSGSRIR